MKTTDPIDPDADLRADLMTLGISLDDLRDEQPGPRPSPPRPRTEWVELPAGSPGIDFTDLLDEPESPPWPPASIYIGRYDHPATEWASALVMHTQALSPTVMHFPTTLVVKEVEHRNGVVLRFVLLSFRMFTAQDRIPNFCPKVIEGIAWGGVVELDGKDVFVSPQPWCSGEDGRGASICSSPS